MDSPRSPSLPPSPLSPSGHSPDHRTSSPGTYPMPGPATPHVFEHAWPQTRVSFGRGSIGRCADTATELNMRAVALIADPIAAAAADRIADDLGSALAIRIEEVQMHVSTTLVKATAVELARTGADGMICIGGGSATGLAKGVAKMSGLPIVAVPTTYAGSEMSSIWGLTEGGRKQTGRLDAVRPVAVLYDPDLTDSMPPHLAVTSGLNSMAHAIEALYSPAQSPLGFVLAEEAVRRMSHALVALIDGGDPSSAREEALIGAWLGGMSLEVSTMGLHHRICHVLGGLLDLPHSPLHSVVLPYAVHHNSPADGLSAALARALPVDVVRFADGSAGRALKRLSTQLGAPASLRSIGMDEDDLPAAVQAVSESIAHSPPVNPLPVTAADIHDLLHAAFSGAAPGS